MALMNVALLDDLESVYSAKGREILGAVIGMCMCLFICV